MAQTTLRDHLQETEDAISAGRIDEALEGCQRILRQYPESLEVQRLLGEVYLAQGHLDEAQHAFDWVITNDPENVIAYCDRALISERRSDFDTALDCYQQAYELSRGNSQIRKEFNKLSEKSGQQGFMFSRAGLARLYMRGDLLTQAVQEWETVLSGSPDRLDARTGLLEAYWREGLTNQVERLATQILDEVPSCLKALLLLAYAVAPKDAQKAQDLLQRAEALDPDLVMAQDLFADMMASQPDDPFLMLLRKSPVGLEISQKMAATLPSADPDKTLAFPASALNASASSHAFADWNEMNAGSNANGADNGQKNALSAQESPALPVWTSDDFPQMDAWRALEKSQEPPSASQSLDVADQMTGAISKIDGRSGPDQGAARPEQNEPPVEAWQALQESRSETEAPQADRQQPSWSDLLPESTFENISGWESPGDAGALETDENWAASARADEAPAPPAWLSMLTQGERKQLAGEPSASSPSSEEKPSEEPAFQSSAPVAFDLPPAKEDKEQAKEPTIENSRSEEQEEEQLSFGPEWLKSLGAATIENAQPIEQARSFAEPQAQPQDEHEQEQQSDYEAWSTPAAGLTEAKEQGALTTLEALEQDLYAQGFTPLEPHSLSTLAQAQEEEVSSLTEPPIRNGAEEPSLIQALAELGNFEQPPAEPPTPEPEPQQFPAQPEWMAALQPSSTPPPVPTSHADQAPLQNDAAAGPVFEPLPFTMEAEAPGESTADIEATVSAPIRRPTSPSGPVRERQAALPGRVDALLASELETTMRRPAVRLQPVQRRSGLLQEYGLPANRGRGSERASGKVVDGNLSYQQRLVRGYQCQLVGDYDEAMQEYQVIVRNAPELLSEVVSNVRALLKLAPRYSAGYRILGDAYMRQGEYLQAMEAYNKALTMARKARA